MLLKQLSELDGAAGDEREVRNFIKENIKHYVDSMETDRLGNLICYKKGKYKKPTVLLAAHMDEVGFMITEKKQDGTLKFSRIGGIDTRVMLSKTLRIGKNKVKGVIGIKPIHLMEDDEYNKVPKFKDLYIDVGAQSNKEIKDIEIGDFAYFDTSFKKTKNGIAKGKAFDDRIGCSLILDLVKEKITFPLYAVFTVQEEIGLRGARVIGNRLNPDYALILEGTGAGDFPTEKDISRIPLLGKDVTVAPGEVEEKYEPSTFGSLGKKLFDPEKEEPTTTIPSRSEAIVGSPPLFLKTECAIKGIPFCVRYKAFWLFPCG